MTRETPRPVTHEGAEPAAQPELTADTQARAQAHHTNARADLPGQHRGMPAYVPQTERATTGEPHTPLDASVKESVELPHQRDQHVAMTGPGVTPQIKQAGEDIAQGRQDTSRSVEMDRTYHEVRKMAPNGTPDQPTQPRAAAAPTPATRPRKP